MPMPVILSLFRKIMVRLAIWQKEDATLCISVHQIAASPFTQPRYQAPKNDINLQRTSSAENVTMYWGSPSMNPKCSRFGRHSQSLLEKEATVRIEPAASQANCADSAWAFLLLDLSK